MVKCQGHTVKKKGVPGFFNFFNWLTPNETLAYRVTPSHHYVMWRQETASVRQKDEEMSDTGGAKTGVFSGF